MDLKIHYSIYKCPPPVPVLSQLDPVHAPISHFLNFHLNIIIPPSLILTSGLFPSGFPIQSPSTPLPHTCYVPSPSLSSRFDNSNNFVWGSTDKNYYMNAFLIALMFATSPFVHKGINHMAAKNDLAIGHKPNILRCKSNT